MAIRLYKFKGGLYTFTRIKGIYEEINNCEMNVDNDTMKNIINHNLVQNGGQLELVQDNILEWCNNYAEYQDADRYLNIEEQEESILNIYLSIIDGDIEDILENLLDDTSDGIPDSKSLALMLVQLSMHCAKFKTPHPYLDDSDLNEFLNMFSYDNGVCKLC